jgi:hypothetical protein
LIGECHIKIYSPTRTHYRDPKSASLWSINLSVFVLTPFCSLLSRHSAYTLMKMTKESSEAINWRRTDNAMAKRKKTIGQTKIYKTLHKKLNKSSMIETIVNMYHDKPTRTHYRDPESASLWSINMSVFVLTPFCSLLSRHSAYTLIRLLGLKLPEMEVSVPFWKWFVPH